MKHPLQAKEQGEAELGRKESPRGRCVEAVDPSAGVMERASLAGEGYGSHRTEMITPVRPHSWLIAPPT